MKTSVATARRLRRTQTDAELKLWLRLRNRQLEGLKFRRQAPVIGYVADLLCEEVKLIVEVDGGQHQDSHRDEVRTAALRTAGFQVLRFWNNDVLQNTDGVLEAIRQAVLLARPGKPRR